MGGPIEGGRHASPRTVAPLFDRGQAGPAGTVVQVESLQVAGDGNNVGTGLLVGVGLGVEDAAGGISIAPVYGDVGSADGQPYGLVVFGGGPGGDKGVVGDIEKVDILYGGNLDDAVVGAAKEVGPGGGDVDRVDGAGGDVLAGLESEGCSVGHLKEVGVGTGDAVDGVVAGQHRILCHDVADRPFVVGDGQVDQADVPEPQVLIEGRSGVEHPCHISD